MTKILLIDDHPLIRRGLVGLLGPEIDLTVCGQLSSAEKVFELIAECSPDIIVTDVSLPGMDGIELVKQLKERAPEIKILVISRHDEDLVARRAIQAGANGYIMKSEPPEEIIKAVRKVLRGGLYLSGAITKQMRRSSAQGKINFMLAPETLLSERELEVFVMLGKALPTNEMAALLGISVKTIESYRARIKEKLNVETKDELVRQAVHWLSSKGELG